MAIYHYARVSTDGQTVENQQLAARQAGYAIDYYFADEAVSGKTSAQCRDQYSVMFDRLKKGDVLVVSEVSRIGRNTVDVLTNIEKFEEVGVKVCVLNYGNLDLTSDIGKFVITMAAAMSQMELADLRRRTKAGLARTKSQGTKLGRPLVIPPAVLVEMVQKKTTLSFDKLSDLYNFPKNTIVRNIAKWKNDLQGYAKEWEVREVQYAN